MTAYSSGEWSPIRSAASAGAGSARNITWWSFGSISPIGNGWAASTAASSAAERTSTGTSTPNAAATATRIASAIVDGSSAASKQTLPLWMIDVTSSCPNATNVARSSAIGIRLCPPTLMPRKRATCRPIVVTVPAGSAILRP